MSAARSSNGFGLNPIAFIDIAAWSQLTRAAPTPWEISLILRIDRAVLPILNRPREEQTSISVKDVDGVSALFAGMRARAAEVFK
ncbi:MAG: hypothetical protein U1E25_14600 [Methylocystis sp.]